MKLVVIEGIGKKNFETLIYADVFKNFRINRKTLIENLDSLINYAELTKDIDPSLVMKPEIEEQEEYSNVFLLEKEKVQGKWNVIEFHEHFKHKTKVAQNDSV